jgi:carotenoid cleavage dioxygenase-like enzyme
MAKAFDTEQPFLRGYYAPLTMESDAAHLPITGELPRELCGTLYRNGPNPQFAPRGFYHWFAGDGMLHAFHLENGNASYRNRWVRTPKWQLEHEAGEALLGAFGNPRWTDPKHIGFDSTLANTNVVWHAGRLLALEEAHAPFAVDPADLAPIGAETWQDKVGRFTAHPKLDPVTGEMVAFAYAAAGRFTPEIDYIVIGADGKLARSERFVAPYSSMVHDFAVTRNHVILPIFPLTGSMERAMKGMPAFAWEPDLGTHVAVFRRDGGPASIRWFKGDARYVFHPMNAFETADGKLVCDMMQYPVAPLFPLPDGKPASEKRPVAKLVRWTLDLAGNTDSWHEEQLDDRAGEFPRHDERFHMQDHRHGWFGAGEPTDGGDGREREGLAHVDFASKALTVWPATDGDRVGEPIFVPRTPDSPEGEGWVLSVIYRGAEKRSDLAVFEATDVARGPVALVHLSHRVPAGFHGNWRPGPL